MNLAQLHSPVSNAVDLSRCIKNACVRSMFEAASYSNSVDKFWGHVGGCWIESRKFALYAFPS